MSHVIADESRRCVDECSSCEDVCNETMNHCLSLGGAHAAAHHITALLDCALLCGIASSFMMRGSALDSQACGLCADACERCAQSCDSVGGDDYLMRRCGEDCRRCAELCRAMSQSTSRTAH